MSTNEKAHDSTSTPLTADELAEYRELAADRLSLPHDIAIVRLLATVEARDEYLLQILGHGVIRTFRAASDTLRSIRAIVAARQDESTEDAVRRAIEEQRRKIEADIICDLVAILHGARETIGTESTAHREILAYLDALAHPERSAAKVGTDHAGPVGLVMTCAHYTDPKKPCQRCTREGCAPCELCEKCQPDPAAVPAK